jgi:hypothetical protein
MCERPENTSTDEIEITPEMIEYVVGELFSFSRDGCETEEETACRIIKKIVEEVR